ncbi:MAG: helix-turn-helix domain-containing protein [Rickettsiales bacterium]|jgi:DNA-binding transcriptional ArsR family regulator|nr:helix-turn-helix domain-containing protein [Rickettsiales bacterium]
MDNLFRFRNELMTAEITANATCVGFVLSQFYRDGKDTYPSLITLMECSKLSKPTVIRALKELEEAKLIVIEKKKTNKSPNAVNSYKFLTVEDEDSTDDYGKDYGKDYGNGKSNGKSNGKAALPEIEEIEEIEEIDEYYNTLSHTREENSESQNSETQNPTPNLQNQTHYSQNQNQHLQNQNQSPQVQKQSDQSNYDYTFQDIQNHYEAMRYFFPSLSEKYGANKDRAWSLDKWKRQMQAWEIDYRKDQRIALVSQNKQKTPNSFKIPRNSPNWNPLEDEEYQAELEKEAKEWMEEMEREKEEEKIKLEKLEKLRKKNKEEEEKNKKKNKRRARS